MEGKVSIQSKKLRRLAGLGVTMVLVYVLLGALLWLLPKAIAVHAGSQDGPRAETPAMTAEDWAPAAWPPLEGDVQELAIAAGSRFTFGLAYDATGLDPAELDGTSVMVTEQIYETLVNCEPDSLLPIPGLAESWSASSDGLTWTFTLPLGIEFHDGSDLDAAAVVYNLERWWDPDHPHHDAEFRWFEWLFGGFKGDPDSLITSLGTTGTHQLQITLSQPHSVVPSKLTMPAFAIASPAAIQAGTLTTTPVGSGPFEFVEWVAEDHIRLAANTAYWGQGPYLETLTFQVIASDTERLAAVQSNALQGARDLAPEYVASAWLDPDLEVMWRPDLDIGYLGINRGHSPLDSLLVRQAIAHAINKQSIIDSHYNTLADYGQVAEQVLPPELWGYNEDLVDYAYDPSLACSLLAQAGYTDGFTTTLWKMPVARGYYPNPAAVAESMQVDLGAVGINATLVTYDWGTYVDKVLAGEADLFLLGWHPDYLHPDDYLATLCSGSDAYGPLDDTLCNQLQAALEEPDYDAQLAIYEWASQRVHDTLPLVPIVHTRTPIVLRRNVAGFVPAPMGESFAGVFYSPMNGHIVPSSGSGPAGAATAFITSWSDQDGWQDLKRCYLHIGANPSVINNVTLLYNPQKDKLWLLSDDGSSWTGGYAPGSANLLENSQAQVDCSLTIAQGHGDRVIVAWAITFKPGFSGNKKLYLKCQDIHNVSSAGENKGNWNVE